MAVFMWEETEKLVKVSIQVARELLMKWREVRQRCENAALLISA
jgi:hypothetical protein